MLISASELSKKYKANMNSVSEALMNLKPISKEITKANRRPRTLYDEREAASALIDTYVRRHDKHSEEAKKWLELAEKAALIRGGIKDDD